MALSKQTLYLAKCLYWILLTCAHLYPVYFPPGNPGSQWPPYIAACPDYLTMIAPNACVDYVGLHSSLLKKSDPANPPAPTDSTRVFNAGGSVSHKAARAQQYGLSWEGIA